jgi:putative thioredoxin
MRTGTVDFARVVLERSRELPVLVDFWAAWCAPCRILGPTLEALAAEAGGRWELVKIDVDAQPELAAEHGIQGIPAVKLFHQGVEVAEFVGALGEEQVRAWLAQHLPDPQAQRLRGLAEAWVSRGREILPELERFVAEHPEQPAARAELALALAPHDPQRARELIRDVPDDYLETKEDVESLIRLVQLGEDVPAKLRPHLAAAREALAAHDLDRTLGHLVDAAMADPHFGDDLARRAAIALFRQLGQDHELTREHRRRLAMALHA